jgi:hypothetical protein
MGFLLEWAQIALLINVLTPTGLKSLSDFRPVNPICQPTEYKEPPNEEALCIQQPGEWSINTNLRV